MPLVAIADSKPKGGRPPKPAATPAELDLARSMLAQARAAAGPHPGPDASLGEVRAWQQRHPHGLGIRAAAAAINEVRWAAAGATTPEARKPLGISAWTLRRQLAEADARSKSPGGPA